MHPIIIDFILFFIIPSAAIIVDSSADRLVVSASSTFVHAVFLFMSLQVSSIIQYTPLVSCFSPTPLNRPWEFSVINDHRQLAPQLLRLYQALAVFVRVFRRSSVANTRHPPCIPRSQSINLDSSVNRLIVSASSTFVHAVTGSLLGAFCS
jgi:hypothetical protein